MSDHLLERTATMSSVSKSTTSVRSELDPSKSALASSSSSSSQQTNETTDNGGSVVGHNRGSFDTLVTTSTPSTLTTTGTNDKLSSALNLNDSSSWSRMSSNNSKSEDTLGRSTTSSSSSMIPNTLDSQQQRLNLLVELISSQEAKLNRLKALRKLVNEQRATNVELNNELRTVNSSISEKDGELRQALNRVDNLNRQLNTHRRTRTHRTSKSLTPTKQEVNNSIDGTGSDSYITDDIINDISSSRAESLPPSSSSAENNSSESSESSEANSSSSSTAVVKKSSNAIPDTQDLTKTKLANTLPDKDESNSTNTNNNSSSAILDTSGKHQVVATHNNASSALTKYTNARQKLIGSALKDRSTGRRVSFDPLALLLDAALEGELDLVIQTSKQVPDLSASHDECVTALHNAVVAGHYEVAKFLIEAGCDINTQDSDGWTPLHCAASCNNLPLVKLLVENGALIYATTTSDHSTPAMKCEQSEEGFEECYKYLMYLQNNLGVVNNGSVYALYDYEAQEPDELSFKIDDELRILRRDDSQEQEWWWAQKQIKETSDDSVVDIKEGYIPRNLVGLYPRVKTFKRPSRISQDSTISKNGKSSPE